MRPEKSNRISIRPGHFGDTKHFVSMNNTAAQHAETKNAGEHLAEYFIIVCINTELANFLIYAFIIRRLLQQQSLHPLFARRDMHPCITWYTYYYYTGGDDCDSTGYICNSCTANKYIILLDKSHVRLRTREFSAYIPFNDGLHEQQNLRT